MRLSLYLLVLGAMLPQCRTTTEGLSNVKVNDELVADADSGVMVLPALKPFTIYMPMVKAKLESLTMAPADRSAYTARIARYLAFLGKTPEELKPFLDRIMQSSTQYLLCDSFEDWTCLEHTPLIEIKSKSRQDSAPDLGRVVDVDEPLRLEWYFTDQWDVDESAIDKSKVLAVTLGKTIRREAKDGMSLAIYGIDDIEGSMNPVYDAILDKKADGVNVRAVFDTETYYKNATAPFPWVFSYKRPSVGVWAFAPADEKMTNLQFQYRNTVDLMNALNKGIADDQKASARIEWPGNGAIMHNKFIVFKKDAEMSVWSGTANIAETCMGTERNSNVGLFIDNTVIAAEFQKEFDEMYEYSDETANGGEKLIAADGGNRLTVGRFHSKKRPNTRRYFHFLNNVETRLHFAPTDDGEHRVVIPMLLSAKAGDVIRIAMFGGGGLETVRAMQYAQAQGAEVRIVFDKLTGSQLQGWLRDESGNLLDANPFIETPRAKITVRRSTWKKQNHHKSASLTRADGRVEEVVIGSQNWSKAGNDDNDENMLTFRNKVASLPIGDAFNKHFDERLWTVSAPGELTQGTSYCEQLGCDSSAAAAAVQSEDESAEAN